MSKSIIYRNVRMYRLAMRLLYGSACRERFRKVCELILETDRTVLELCFGDVAVAEHCRRRGLRWVGLDLSEAFVAYARRRGFDARLADLLQGGAFPPCDVCVMMGSLYHFDRSLPELFTRIKRASRRLLISEPVKNWSHAGGFRRLAARAFTRAGERDETFRFDETSLIRTLDRLGREVGFEYRVVSVSRDMIVEVIWSS